MFECHGTGCRPVLFPGLCSEISEMPTTGSGSACQSQAAWQSAHQGLSWLLEDLDLFWALLDLPELLSCLKINFLSFFMY